MILLKDEIDVRHAQKALADINIASFPNMTEEAQEEFTSTLTRGIQLIRGTYFDEQLDRAGIENLKQAMNVKGSKMKVK